MFPDWSFAGYSETGIVTRPKLIAPFQSARAMTSSAVGTLIQVLYPFEAIRTARSALMQQVSEERGGWRVLKLVSK